MDAITLPDSIPAEKVIWCNKGRNMVKQKGGTDQHGFWPRAVHRWLLRVAAPLITSLDIKNSPEAWLQKVRTEQLPIGLTKTTSVLSSLKWSYLSSWHNYQSNLSTHEVTGYCLNLKIPEWSLHDLLLLTPSLQPNPQVLLATFLYRCIHDSIEKTFSLLESIKLLTFRNHLLM